jgi:hypothetical protein
MNPSEEALPKEESSPLDSGKIEGGELLGARRIRRPSMYKDFEDTATLSANSFRSRVSSHKKPVKQSSDKANMVGDVSTSSIGPSGSKVVQTPTSAKSTKKLGAGGAHTTKAVKAGVVSGVTSTTTTLNPNSKNVKDPKEKALDEMEEALISTALRRRPLVPTRKSLPIGPARLLDMNTALTQSYVDISIPLYDWTIPEAKMIGWICKVYWDGEDEWFYARILNYDQFHKKHYVSHTAL